MNPTNAISYRLLYITAPNENDPNYKKMMNYINQDNIKQLLNDNKIKVGSFFNEQSKFLIILYELGGMPIDTFNEFDENKFNKLLDKIKINQKGGSMSNKDKYYFYKTEYKKNKSIITKFSF